MPRRPVKPIRDAVLYDEILRKKKQMLTPEPNDATAARYLALKPRPQPPKRSPVVYGANHLWTDESEEEDEVEKRKERPARRPAVQREENRREQQPRDERDTNSPHVNLLGEPLPLENRPQLPTKQPDARGPPKPSVQQLMAQQLANLSALQQQLASLSALQQQQRLFPQAPPLPFLPPPLTVAQPPGYPTPFFDNFAFNPQPMRPMPPPLRMGGPAGGYSIPGMPKIRAIWTEEDRRQQAAVSTARPAQKTKETRTKKTAEQKRQRAKKPPTAQPTEQKKIAVEETVARAKAQGDLLFERLRKMRDEVQQPQKEPTAQPAGQETNQTVRTASI
ncbi:hypothetical protein M3Y99_00588200 [Aphelenchoides fujianensis]|nr:hypothetical protein M3Y99_00588200 [Aphelenchoides fujianensis]